MQRQSFAEGTSSSSKQLQGFQKVNRNQLKSGEFGQNMPREGSKSLGRSSSGTERLSSQPFLTEEQRIAFNAVLATKKSTDSEVAVLPSTPSANGGMQSSGGSIAAANPNAAKAGIKAVHTTKAKGDAAHDRHMTRNPKAQGKTKKGGAGGKYTWGGMLADTQDGVAMDHNDPNYDSDEEGLPVSLEYEYAADLQDFKSQVVETIDEYFDSRDVKEAAASLVDLDQPELHHWVVKKAVTMSMDRHDKEREMVSCLLSSLYNVTIAADQMHKGFTSLGSAVDDLTLDVPSAPEILAKFISRAIVDEILPPSFVGCLASGGKKEQTEVKRSCEVLLSGRHAAEKLQRCWGCSAEQSLEETCGSIYSLLREFQNSHDLEEADRCLRGLNVPFFHHELVKQLLLICMSNDTQQDLLLQLLRHLAASGELSSSQITKGFHRVNGNLEDICLDNPHGAEQLQQIVSRATSQGWLESDWDTQLLPLRSSSSTHGSPRTVQAFKSAAIRITQEFLTSEDHSDAAQSLGALDEDELHGVFVKQAVIQGLSCKARERELVSQLLAHLSHSLLSAEQAAAGFTLLLIAAEDLVLDCPNAAHHLTRFLARAVADGVLQTTFLQSVLPSLSDASLGVSIVQSAANILVTTSAENLRTCWGVSTQRTTAELQAQMQDIVVQFVSRGDGDRACRMLLELGVPAYHHELVAIVFALACADDNPEPLIALLDLLAQTGTVSQTQMVKGFERVQAQLSTASADSTHAQTCFSAFKQHAASNGWLAVESSA